MAPQTATWQRPNLVLPERVTTTTFNHCGFSLLMLMLMMLRSISSLPEHALEGGQLRWLINSRHSQVQEMCFLMA